MPREQRRRLYVISLTTFFLVATLLTGISFKHIKRSYYDSLERTLADYVIELSSILETNSLTFSLLTESLMIAGPSLDPSEPSATPFGHDTLKRILTDRWSDISFSWNVYSAHLYFSTEAGVRLDADIGHGINPDRELLEGLALASQEQPSYRIYCEQDCYLFRGTPILFPDGSASVLIMSSSLADIFLSFSKNNNAHTAIIDMNQQRSPSTSQALRIFYASNHALSNIILKKVVNEKLQFSITHNDSDLADISAVEHENKYFATFIIDFHKQYNLNKHYKIAVIKDMTAEYQNQRNTNYRNIVVYGTVILGGCSLLLIAFWIGITQRFRTLELALEAQRKIIEDKVLISTFDDTGKISSMSKALIHHPATPNADVQHLRDLFQQTPQGNHHVTEIMHSISADENWQSEITFTDIAGEARHLVGVLSDLTHRSSEKHHYTLLFEDVTDKKKIKQYLEEVKNLDKFRRELITHVSHDLRTPLTALRGHVETCLLGIDEMCIKDLRNMLNIALTNSEQLSRLIDQLFELSLLSKTHVQLNMEIVPIAELVQDVFFTFENISKTAEVNLHLAPKDSSILVLADAERIERVFTNLIGNAIRHCPAGSSVNVCFVDEGAGNINIQIFDTGIGIHEAELGNIFDSYYQATNSVKQAYAKLPASTQSSGRPATGNKGLGLAITKRIIDLHDSCIQVASVVGKGTYFNFNLKKANLQ